MTSMQEFNESLNGFFAFVNKKLANYPQLSIGEKISYPLVFIGLLLILSSVVLFII